MHPGIVQDKRGRVHKRIADIPGHDAHFNALGRTRCVQHHHAVQESPLVRIRHVFPDNRQEIQVTLFRLVAAHRRGAVKVDTQQIVLQDLPGAFHKQVGRFIPGILILKQPVPDSLIKRPINHGFSFLLFSGSFSRLSYHVSPGYKSVKSPAGT